MKLFILKNEEKKENISTIKPPPDGQPQKFKGVDFPKKKSVDLLTIQ